MGVEAGRAQLVLQVEHLVEDLAEGHTHPVSLMAAPAFSGDGSAVLNISVHVWRDLDPAGIRAIGDRLLAASRTITRDIGGRVPADFPGAGNHPMA